MILFCFATLHPYTFSDQMLACELPHYFPIPVLERAVSHKREKWKSKPQWRMYFDDFFGQDYAFAFHARFPKYIGSAGSVAREGDFLTDWNASLNGQPVSDIFAEERDRYFLDVINRLLKRTQSSRLADFLQEFYQHNPNSCMDWIREKLDNKQISPNLFTAHLSMYRLAQTWLKKRLLEHMAKAEQGDAEAKYQVALAYTEGRGVFPCIIAAQNWCEKAAKAGHAEAIFQMAIFLDDHDEQQFELVTQSAEAGCAKAIHFLGLYYWQEEKEYSTAFPLFERAFELGWKDSGALAAFCQINGVGTRKDAEKGLDTMVRLAEMGSFPAHVYLFNYYKDQKDIEKALYYCEWLAESGDVDYQMQLVEWYKDKKLPCFAWEKAMSWLYRAVSQDLPEAKALFGSYFGWKKRNRR